MTLPVYNIDSTTLVIGTNFCSTPFGTDTHWHSHAQGILCHVKQGLFSITCEQKSFILSPGMMIFMPPGVSHYESCLLPNVSGWFISIPVEQTSNLPNVVTEFKASHLIQQLCEKVISWGTNSSQTRTDSQLRLILTLLDELLSAEEEDSLSIPMPAQPGLAEVAKMVMLEPNDKNTLDHWAKIAGMSRRSFTEHFSKATGLSFVNWRQRVKLRAALELLFNGKTVTEVSLNLGFSNTSSFIEQFRKQFGMTPKQYIQTSINRG